MIFLNCSLFIFLRGLFTPNTTFLEKGHITLVTQAYEGFISKSGSIFIKKWSCYDFFKLFTIYFFMRGHFNPKTSFLKKGHITLVTQAYEGFISKPGSIFIKKWSCYDFLKLFTIYFLCGGFSTQKQLFWKKGIVP